MNAWKVKACSSNDPSVVGTKNVLTNINKTNDTKVSKITPIFNPLLSKSFGFKNAANTPSPATTIKTNGIKFKKLNSNICRLTPKIVVSNPNAPCKYVASDVTLMKPPDSYFSGTKKNHNTTLKATSAKLSKLANFLSIIFNFIIQT